MHTAFPPAHSAETSKYGVNQHAWFGATSIAAGFAGEECDTNHSA